MQRSRRWVYLLFTALILTVTDILAVLLYNYALGPQSDESILTYWLGVGISCCIIALSQVALLIPLVKPTSASTKGKSLGWSIVVAGFLAALLTVGFGLMIASLVSLCISTNIDDWGYIPYAILRWWEVVSVPVSFSDEGMRIFILELVVLCISWIFWSLLLWSYVQRRHRDPRALTRILSWLFASTFAEALLNIPLLIIINRRSDCYCATGSFGALILSIMVCLWLLGPGIVIVIFWRKRPWERDHCIKCGYPRKVTAATVCSECGTTFKN